MKIINAVDRTIIFLFSISLIYALLDAEILMLTPLLTIILPHKLLRENSEDKKTLRNLIIFNLITFLSISTVLNKTSLAIFEMITNLVVVFVYFLISISIEKQNEEIKKNPEKLYEKLNRKIISLEKMKEKIDESIKDEKDEKIKDSMISKKNIIDDKIYELKSELDNIKKRIELKNKK